MGHSFVSLRMNIEVYFEVLLIELAFIDHYRAFDSWRDALLLSIGLYVSGEQHVNRPWL